MTGWERVEELAARAENILRSHGYMVERIGYPSEHDRRSIDLIAVKKGHGIFIKVAEDAEDVSQADVRELQSCSRVLRASGLIVAEREAGEEIDDIVAHERMGVYVVSPGGLEAALQRSIYVVKRQRSYYMMVDGARLHELRVSRGYSLGDVASRLSVSRRSVYQYEQEESMVSLPVALRLMELFGEEIFKPIDVMAQRFEPPRGQGRTKLGKLLSEAGMSVAETRHIPPNAVASSGDVRLIVIVERRRGDDVERRLEEGGRVASKLEAHVILVGREASRGLAERYDAVYAASVEEAAAIARRLARGEETP
ncbi:MAG: helix-turn-helix domain-containing protein [Crenarchaeota archaeon]|nr:helix-turn-helix domain-containing protein [Thermoproteota archaeon]